MRKAWHRMLCKVRDRVDYFHKCLCKFLVTTFKVILLPLFNVSSLVNKTSRNIGPSVSRSIHVWSHFRFRELLKAKVVTTSGCTLHICDERYTTKICTKCGFSNNTVEASKEYTCPGCGMCHSRDVSAARNILIRYLVKYEITLPTNPFNLVGPSESHSVETLAHASLNITKSVISAEN